MEVYTYQQPEVFRQRVESYLLQKEDIHNLALGIINHLADPNGQYDDATHFFMATVEDAGQIKLVMVKSTSYLVLSSLENDLDEAMSVAVSYLLEHDLSIPGVIGVRSIADAFINHWKEKSQQTVTVAMKQRIYRLEEVNDVINCPGKCRAATSEDIEQVTKWIQAFSAEALEPVSSKEARDFAERCICKQSLYIWEDHVPVSMANSTRPTKNGIVINAVYTPPEYRNHGYATACVAALSQHLLNSGYHFCTLYTDLANPTSNSIYMKIGYRPIAESIVYKF
ncbi:acetyltransferase [Caldalkalibacillus thermarum]|uniref:GNAT family N-acetyltransferase n=1 Tax=Caldalkalibacillus thermarum TaxID=296745 RepID=UPI001662C169|nr:GNAT family N-acetyltransferase [Caldalkalibacillus thermarum]GGK32203.1 acetyltransferase [Caldalkalibacillus thermarum]